MLYPKFMENCVITSIMTSVNKFEQFTQSIIPDQ